MKVAPRRSPQVRGVSWSRPCASLPTPGRDPRSRRPRSGAPSSGRRPSTSPRENLAGVMSNGPIIARALQLGERIDLKGLERPDQFSSSPLGFKVAGSGTVVLFRFGAAVFVGLNPVEEDGIVKGLVGRLVEP